MLQRVILPHAPAEYEICRLHHCLPTLLFHVGVRRSIPRDGGWSFTEEDAPEPYQCGAFLDGDLKVVAHAHRKLRPAAIGRARCFTTELVAQRAQPREDGAHIFGTFGDGG